MSAGSVIAEHGNARRRRFTREESRAHIVRAAESVIREKGFTQASIGEVATILGMTTANIYRHFSSKKALANAVCETLSEVAIGHLSLVVVTNVPAAVKLRNLVHENARNNAIHLYNDPHILDLIRLAALESWPAFAATRRGFRKLLETIIHDGVHEGSFRADLDPCMAGTVLLLLSPVMHPLLRQEIAPEAFDTEVDRMIDLLVRAFKVEA
ncbi:MAG: TetR/AcrR family transcriptional regulator [Janthinobacterium lividum]